MTSPARSGRASSAATSTRLQAALLAGLERRVIAVLRWRELLVGVASSLRQLLFILGLLLSVLWSYSVWGSEDSPLSRLLWAAIGCFALSFALWIGVRLSMGWLRRAARVQRRRREVRERLRASNG